MAWYQSLFCGQGGGGDGGFGVAVFVVDGIDYVVIVVGVLGALATLKYQSQKSDGAILATEEVLEQDAIDERQQQDVAIVMVDEDESDVVETEKAE